MNIELIKSKIRKKNGKPLEIKSDFAVLVPLIKVDDKLHILYEVRSNKLDTQPGEISFPGGMVEEGEIFKEAAIRETCEELNISKKSIDFIGALDYIISPFNISIYPYVGLIKGIDVSKINYSLDEVAKIFTVPLEYFIENKPKKYYIELKPKTSEDFPLHLIPNGKDYKWRTGKYPVFFYDYNDYIIWGITARITESFIDTLQA